MCNNYNKLLLVLILGIFGVFQNSYSQNQSQGFYYNDDLCSYIFFEKDTFYLYNTNSAGNSKNLIKLRFLNSKSLVGIPIEDTVKTTVSATSLKDNSDTNMAYFTIKDIGGYRFTDTMSCFLNYYDTDNNWISEQLYLSQDNGQYCFDFGKYPFDSAKLKIDWFFEKIFLMDKIDNPIVTISKGQGKLFNIVVAPIMKYPKVSREIKVTIDDDFLVLRNVKQTLKNFPKRKIYFYNVEPNEIDGIFRGIVEKLIE